MTCWNKTQYKTYLFYDSIPPLSDIMLTYRYPCYKITCTTCCLFVYVFVCLYVTHPVVMNNAEFHSTEMNLRKLNHQVHEIGISFLFLQNREHYKHYIEWTADFYISTLLHKATIRPNKIICLFPASRFKKIFLTWGVVQ